MRTFDHKTTLKLASKKGADITDIRPFLDQDLEREFLLAKTQGLEVITKDNRYFFNTTTQSLEESTFCIVDIECNGSKPSKHQIIEIGAVKVKNGKIIETYESLIQCNEISRHISELTGIEVSDTLNAPSMQKVLNAFRAFIGTDVFVAHAVKFDYNFICAMYENLGMPPMLNRSMCSIDLAERTFSSFRYGLTYLNETLGLHQEADHHRALSDAITTTALFMKSLNLVDDSVQTAEALIQFSKQAKRFKRPKFDPMLKNGEV